MHRGFTGMGLSELLKTAEVPKGSFYHYFRSKEAFGVALLEHHYTGYLQRLVDHFDHGDGNYRDRLLAYYQHTLNQFCQQGIISGCLTVKLSAEVCDLSEDMRAAMDRGASQIIALLGDALEKGRQEGSLAFDGEAMIPCGSGPTCRPKLRVAQRRWKAPLPTPNRLLQRLRYNRRFYFISY